MDKTLGPTQVGGPGHRLQLEVSGEEADAGGGGVRTERRRVDTQLSLTGSDQGGKWLKTTPAHCRLTSVGRMCKHGLA